MNQNRHYKILKTEQDYVVKHIMQLIRNLKNLEIKIH